MKISPGLIIWREESAVSWANLARACRESFSKRVMIDLSLRYCLTAE
jgi:hypothetical protein